MDANSILPPHFNLTGQLTIQNVPDFMGNYSFVYRGLLRGNFVAVKVIKATGEPESMKRKVLRERAIWGSLNHRNIHPFYGFADDPALGPFGALVSPWSAKGDASRFLKENGQGMKVAERINLWKGVIEGVIYLHDQTPPIVHGDLKPGNVLIDDSVVPKICDFGLSRIFLEQGSTGMTTTSEHTGTARYLAPELVASDVTVYPTLASDVYALDCLGLEFIYLQQPFSNHVNNLRGQIFRDLRRGLPPAAERPQQAWPSLRSWPMLLQCWNSDPHSRLSAFAAVHLLGQTDFTFPLVVVRRIAHLVSGTLWPSWGARCEGLLSLCLVSKAYRTCTIPFLYREIRLDLTRHPQSLFALMYALENVTTKTLLSPREPDGYGTSTKSLLLFIPENSTCHRDVSVGIRNLVNKLPGLRLTIISSNNFHPPAARVRSLTTLTLHEADLAFLFDQMPTLHMLESIERLSMNKCQDSARSRRLVKTSFARVYLPNLLELAFNDDDDYPLFLFSPAANPFAIISTWIMPRLRSLQFECHSNSPRSLIGPFNFLRVHGSQLQHITFRCPRLSEQETSDMLQVCNNLRSLNLDSAFVLSSLFDRHVCLENIRVIRTLPVAVALEALKSLILKAQNSFPRLMEVEFHFNLLEVVAFRTGDPFITHRFENKTFRLYIGHDTYVEAPSRSWPMEETQNRTCAVRVLVESLPS